MLLGLEIYTMYYLTIESEMFHTVYPILIWHLFNQIMGSFQSIMSLSAFDNLLLVQYMKQKTRTMNSISTTMLPTRCRKSAFQNLLCNRLSTDLTIISQSLVFNGWTFISENSRKLYVADLANGVHCNFLPEALLNTVSSYEAAYWLERISYNFLICS